MAKCGATTKSKGTPCQRDAMKNGRCMIHGGKTPETNQNAVKHGFYSKCLDETELELWDSIKTGDLTNELKLARIQLRRAMLIDKDDEKYRPDVIERLLATVGRLEKNQSDIGNGGDDGIDWAAIGKLGASVAKEMGAAEISQRAAKTDNGDEKV